MLAGANCKHIPHRGTNTGLKQRNKSRINYLRKRLGYGQNDELTAE